MHTGSADILGLLREDIDEEHLIQELRSLKGLSTALQVCEGLVHVHRQRQLVQILACAKSPASHNLLDREFIAGHKLVYTVDACQDSEVKADAETLMLTDAS